jgi:AcrR family transcriptional regulator
MATATAEHLPVRTREATRVRRADILDAALECFTRSGFEGTTMEDIRAESGASIGSIYHHFGGKEQLAAALHLEGLADYQESFVRALSGSAAAERAVKGVVRNHLRWVARNPKLARFMLSGREPEVARASQESLVAMNQRLIEVTRAWIEREVAAGRLRPMPTRLYYAVLIGPAHEFARQWLSDPEPRAIEKAAPLLAEAAWRAVRA